MSNEATWDCSFFFVYSGSTRRHNARQADDLMPQFVLIPVTPY